MSDELIPPGSLDDVFRELFDPPATVENALNGLVPLTGPEAALERERHTLELVRDGMTVLEQVPGPTFRFEPVTEEELERRIAWLEDLVDG